MARLSDIIEDFIKEMLMSNEEKELQIQRNELAQQFRCAPSQINYVLTTRFTADKGYYIESRRGGGGYIIIRHIGFDENESLFNMLNKEISNSITFHNACSLVESLLEADVIDEKVAKLIKVAINDRTLDIIPEGKNEIRANILKNMLFVLLS
ncbi:CtsR family transcriptional regulator [Clostridium cochlearium]|jgi:transcriptional regulator CtsR|uniref:Transcriptional regulator CtsR n=1 Tax=Clostridium cochlearium TaxID=1494 RepID=A0A2X2YBM2_CLOCO|nr:CtsR family transcriptional regulator [Clostridium cochlearium]MBE6065120.1 CtsR family transcriptional regulator [Clostridium cochlearium]MBU5269789.1 CtsR family transcriptional regulator [Clostridium cochlearium]MDU1443780.1 CtsR family transcriptional regulator [Clostridium cochlearium]SQB35930.1 transcriptional regulator ctsR [Clostridium cochlearium]